MGRAFRGLRAVWSCSGMAGRMSLKRRRVTRWALALALFVASILVGGLTGFNEQPASMRLPMSLLLIGLGQAISQAVRPSQP